MDGEVIREKDLRFLAIPVAVVVVLHLAWAGLFLVPDAHPGSATALSLLRDLMGSNVATGFLVGSVAVLAFTSLWVKRPVRRILFLLPQQAVLGISAAAAVRAMSLSHFADGVARDRAFIVADQIPAVLLLLAHATVILVLISAWLEGNGRLK